MVEKRKRGRPVGKIGCLNNSIQCRLSAEDYKSLQEASEKHGMSVSDIVRAGVKMELNLLTFRE